MIIFQAVSDRKKLVRDSFILVSDSFILVSDSFILVRDRGEGAVHRRKGR